MKDKDFELKMMEHEKKANKGKGKQEVPVSFGEACYYTKSEIEKAIFEMLTDQPIQCPSVRELPNGKRP